MPLNVRGHQHIMRGNRLEAAVRPSKALNGGIRPPPRLQQVMNAPLLVLHAETGMVAFAGPPRVGEDQHPLVAVLERFRIRLAGLRRAFLPLGFTPPVFGLGEHPPP